MCSCGCNTCDTKKPALMLNESVAPREILSEGLKYHIDNKKPLTEHVYRAGSSNYFNLWAEARYLYSRNAIYLNDTDKEIILETNLGEYAIFENQRVPLDLPMLEEVEDSSLGSEDIGVPLCSMMSDRVSP